MTLFRYPSTEKGDNAEGQILFEFRPFKSSTNGQQICSTNPNRSSWYVWRVLNVLTTKLADFKQKRYKTTPNKVLRCHCY